VSSKSKYFAAVTEPVPSSRLLTAKTVKLRGVPNIQIYFEALSLTIFGVEGNYKYGNKAYLLDNQIAGKIFQLYTLCVKIKEVWGLGEYLLCFIQKRKRVNDAVHHHSSLISGFQPITQTNK